jgi:hypothetical protein
MIKADCVRIIDRYVTGLRYEDNASGQGDTVSCLGLVRKFLREEMGIAEPFPWPDTVDPVLAGAALHRYFRPINTPSIGDVALTDGRHGESLHVGIYIFNGSVRSILHASSQCGIICQPVKEVVIRGYYRHRGLA